MLAKTTTAAVTLGFTLIIALFLQGAYASTHENGTKTIAHRNLTIELGEGMQTDAELTMPILANRSLPAILLIHGTGPLDRDHFIPPDSRPFREIAEYLSERGFVVLRYDKRAIGANSTIENPDLWYNQTIYDLISDANKTLHVLSDQPEVDRNDISILGVSQGAWIATRVAADNPFVKNVLLLSGGAEKWGDLIHTFLVNTTLQYSREVLDTSEDGFVSLSEAIATENTPYWTVAPIPSMMLVESDIATGTGYRFVEGLETEELDGQEAIEIDTTLRSFLEQRFQSIFDDTEDRTCPFVVMCPPMLRTFAGLDNLSVIGNISSSSILMMQGGRDVGLPSAQPLMLEQRLLSVNHPDHSIMVYPDHGHYLTNIGEDSWIDMPGPIPTYILEDIYFWLTDPDRKLSRQSDMSIELSALS
jgi:pimeloyl-ACP methyl ester carboxylesterase